MIAFVGYALMDFIVLFAHYVVGRIYTEASSSTFVILGLVFQAIAYVSVPMLASSDALENEAETL